MTVTSFTVDDLEGSSSVELKFSGPGSKTVNLTIQHPFKMLSATMNVSGGSLLSGGSTYPQNVTVDVGGDGNNEWAFNGVGEGHLGLQDVFSDGNLAQDLSVEGAPTKTFDLLIPKNATIKDANITVTPLTTPTQRMYNRTDAEMLSPASAKSHLLKGINSTDIIINDTVRLEDIKALRNAIDVDQDRYNQSYTFMPNDRLGQSFMINSSDVRLKGVELYTIELGSQPMMGSGVDYEIAIYNASPGSDYHPTGGPMATKHIFYWFNGYLNFTFDTPVSLKTDQVYFFSIWRISGNSPILNFDAASVNENARSKYPVDGCYQHRSMDNGGTWTTFYGNELVFRTHTQKARPIDLQESQNITVDNRTFASFNGMNMTFRTEQHYSSLGWNISLNNKILHDIFFNFSAELYFHDAPDNVSVDIGADGTSEYSNSGNMTVPVVLNDIKDKIESAIQSSISQGKTQTDAYGNALVLVPIKVSGHGKGYLRVKDLNITYEYISNVPGILTAIEEYASTHGGTGPKSLKIPLVVSTSTAGIVNISGVKIIFDAPPQKIGVFPVGLSIQEEGSNNSMVDLNDFFIDDFDVNIKYSIIDLKASGAPANSVNVSVTAASMLSVNVSKAINWSGLISFKIMAIDDTGLNTTTGPINVTVTNINDAPAITSAFPKYANVGKQYRYNLSIVDSDSASFNMWLEKAPLTMDLDRPSMAIIWTPGQADLGTHKFELTASDGQLECVQNITVTVRPSGGGGQENRPPMIDAIGNKTVYLSDDLSLQLEAIDPDLDVLDFSLISGPDGLVVNSSSGLVTWHPDRIGNYTATIQVSDGFLDANMTFNITVIAKPPVGALNITIERPYPGEKITGPLTIIGRASVKGGTVTKVEYQVDNGPWQVTDLMPDGSWSAEYSTKDLKKGTHTLLVRATDLSGQKGQTYTTFVFKGRNDGQTSSGLDLMQVLPYLLLLFIIVGVVIIGLALAWARSKARVKTDSSSKARARRSSSSTKDKTVSGAMKEDASTDVESAFLVYHDGRLITYSSRNEIADLDATLQVIKDFVKASFRGDVGRLDSLRYENMNIILERGVQMYLVVITPQEDNVALQTLRRKMRSFLGDVHGRYRHLLKVWDGKYKTVKPIEKMVDDLVKDQWSPGPGKEADARKKDDDEGKDVQSKRWDESLDLEDKDLSKVEKQKLLQDKLTRGEITEDEFEKLNSKLG